MWIFLLYPQDQILKKLPIKDWNEQGGMINRFTTTRDEYNRFPEKKMTPTTSRTPSTCTTIGFPIHFSQVNTSLHTPKITPPSTPKSTTKRKEDEFQSPPSRKTARGVLLETPQYMDLNLENLFSFPSFNESDFPTLHITRNPTLNDASAPRTQVGVTTSSTQKPPLPPPNMLKITLNYREQLRTIIQTFKKLKSKTTGEFLKQYRH
ncbi:hypothetical protein TNIN_475411 [Trichonephila inaurata madagascariensis]|uniref:Uncharacterized protein n=1 Tax=Trichonephila inaurata madagascariensis TaxID=2747483 RepID=A0A8X7C0B7_9ARAC|nr:hypothetical protein TNIN_475411 [Trichonephila inaurata madagascariensis]